MYKMFVLSLVLVASVLNTIVAAENGTELEQGYLVGPHGHGVAVVYHRGTLDGQDYWTEPLTFYSYQHRYYLGAEEGRPFGIKLRVPAGLGRFAVEVSVDGLNILSKEPTTAEPGSGFVVESNNAWHQHLLIPGYTSAGGTKAKQFVFSGRAGSLAVKKGRPNNIGVIGIRVWAEKGWSPAAHANVKGIDLGGVRSRGVKGINSGDSHDLGTAAGRKVDFATTQVDFDRGELITELSFEYASLEALRRAGVIRSALGGNPSAFPSR